LDTVPTRITWVMNDGLLKPFEEKEVKDAPFQMFPTKAPGPYGFPALSAPLGGVRVRGDLGRS
jgi:hypothetical protein